MKPVRRCAALLFMLGFGSAFVAAQEQPAEQAPAERPATIPIADLTVRFQEARVAVREIDNELQAETLSDRADRELETIGAEVERLQSPAYELAPGTAPPDELADRIGEWRGIESRLVDLEAQLGQRTGQINFQLEDLRDRDAVWRATLDLAEQEELPEDVVDRVSQFLDNVTGVRQALRERRSTLLTLQTRLDDLLTASRDDLNLALAAAEETRRQLLLQDALPLWTALWSGEADGRLAEQTAAAFERDWRSLRDFISRSRTRLILEFLLFLALAAVLAVLRRRTDWSADDAALRRVGRILDRPFSASLLFVSLGSVMVHPQVPTAYEDLIRLLLVVSLVRILPGIVLPVFRPYVLLFAGIYVVESLSVVAGRGTLLERLMLLAVALAGLWLMSRLAALPRAKDASRWRIPLLPIIYLAGAFFLVSILANFAGAAKLASWLARATLTSIYAGLLFRILFLLVDGLAVLWLRSKAARRVRAFREHAGLVHRRFRQVLMLATIAAWMAFSLDYFEIFDEAGSALDGALAFSFGIGSLTVSVGSVVALIVVVWLSFMISAIVRFLLNEQVLPELEMPRGTRVALSQLTHYIILFLGFLLAIKAGGIDLTSFSVIAGAFGVGIGFGLQSVVNNFVSGIILLFERPIHVGDRIQVGPYHGDVTRIGIRASVVRTFEGAEIIVPNGNLLSNEVTNWTLSDAIRRVTIPIGVAYGTDPERVLQLLQRIADENSKVLGFPEPGAFFVNHGESSLDFELRVWLRSEDYFRTRSDLTTAVNRALDAAAIEIPFPQRDLHLRSVDAPAGKALTDPPPPDSDNSEPDSEEPR